MIRSQYKKDNLEKWPIHSAVQIGKCTMCNFTKNGIFILFAYRKKNSIRPCNQNSFLVYYFSKYSYLTKNFFYNYLKSCRKQKKMYYLHTFAGVHFFCFIRWNYHTDKIYMCTLLWIYCILVIAGNSATLSEDMLYYQKQDKIMRSFKE